MTNLVNRYVIIEGRDSGVRGLTNICRLTNDTANKTYVEFGHDTTIDLALTALGLAK